jgi:hypothetical protein
MRHMNMLDVELLVNVDRMQTNKEGKRKGHLTLHHQNYQKPSRREGGTYFKHNTSKSREEPFLVR